MSLTAILKPSESNPLRENLEKNDKERQMRSQLKQSQLLQARQEKGLKESLVSHLLLSRKQIKMNTQEDEIKDLRRNLVNMTEENKTIRTLNFRQQKEIDNIQNKDFSLANIFKQHEAEIIILKEQIKKSRLTFLQEQKLRKDMENECLSLRTSLFKTQEIVRESNSLETYEIKKQLDKAKEFVALKQVEFESLKKQLENQEKHYKIEMSTVQKQIRSYHERCQELEAHVALLKNSLKEKQKVIDIQNIYSNRINFNKMNRKTNERFPDCPFISMSDLINKKRSLNVTSKSALDLPRMSTFEYSTKSNIEDICDRNLIKNDIEKERPLTIEDIRKIIVQEIMQKKYSIVNNQISSGIQNRIFFPTNVPKSDLTIESPIIKIDDIESDYCTKHSQIKAEETKKVLKFEINLKHQNQCNIDKPERKRFKSVIPQNVLHNKDIGLKSQIKSQNTVSNLPDIPEAIEIIATGIYTHPNSFAVVYNENWIQEMETINSLNDVIKDGRKLEKNEENDVYVMNNADKSNNMIKSVFKLPQPVIEDLKDRNSVINKRVKNNLLDNVFGNRDMKLQKNLKNSLHSFIFPKHVNKVDERINQI